MNEEQKMMFVDSMEELADNVMGSAEVAHTYVLSLEGMDPSLQGKVKAIEMDIRKAVDGIYELIEKM